MEGNQSKGPWGFDSPQSPLHDGIKIIANQWGNRGCHQTTRLRFALEAIENEDGDAKEDKRPEEESGNQFEPFTFLAWNNFFSFFFWEVYRWTLYVIIVVDYVR